MSTIALVGSRALAPALCKLLSDNGHTVAWWQPEHLAPTTPALDEQFERVQRVELEAIRDIPVVVVCSPFEALRQIANELGTVISGRHIVVHCTRALEPLTFATASEILKEETSTHRFGFLTGPIRTKDLESGMLGGGILASAFPEVHELFEQLLVSPSFRLYRTLDIQGAQLAASYVRVIAYVIGVASAMGAGVSIESTLFARGLAEMSNFVGALGGQTSTTFGISGTGNLFAEVQSPGSLAFRLGQATLAEGRFDLESFGQAYGPGVKEFWTLLTTLNVALKTHNIHANIFQATYAMAVDGLEAKDAAASLMSLPVLEG